MTDNAIGKIIISLDPPEHERMRKLVNRVFTPRAVDGVGIAGLEKPSIAM